MLTRIVRIWRTHGLKSVAHGLATPYSLHVCMAWLDHLRALRVRTWEALEQHVGGVLHPLHRRELELDGEGRCVSLRDAFEALRLRDAFEAVRPQLGRRARRGPAITVLGALCGVSERAVEKELHRQRRRPAPADGGADELIIPPAAPGAPRIILRLDQLRAAVAGIDCTNAAPSGTLGGAIGGLVAEIDKLIEKLRSGKFEERMTAFDRIAALPDASKVESVLVLARDAEAPLHARKDAMLLLERSGSSPAVGALTELLGDAHPEVRAQSVQSLAALAGGSLLRAKLEALLADPAPVVRVVALDAAGRTLPREVVDAAVRRGLRDPNSAVRQLAAKIAHHRPGAWAEDLASALERTEEGAAGFLEASEVIRSLASHREDRSFRAAVARVAARLVALARDANADDPDGHVDAGPLAAGILAETGVARELTADLADILDRAEVAPPVLAKVADALKRSRGGRMRALRHIIAHLRRP